MKKLACLSLALCSTAMADVDSRIIGGKTSVEGAWPATVALLNKAKTDRIENGEASYNDGETIPAYMANFHGNFCDGTLINDTWVLTAAHCVYDDETHEIALPESMYILAGVSNLLDSGVRLQPKQVIVHEEYGRITGETYSGSDIALIELEPYGPMPSISPYLGEVAPGEQAVAVGWGLSSYDEYEKPAALQEADFEVVDLETCRQSYADLAGVDLETPEGRADIETLITDDMICVYDPEYTEAVCNGDSGGPLMAIQQEEYRQIGIVSFGVAGCHADKYYSVFTKVSSFDAWIRYHTGSAAF